MGRLSLKDFRAKQLKVNIPPITQQLLGQVLGDCHDSNTIGGKYNEAREKVSNDVKI